MARSRINPKVAESWSKESRFNSLIFIVFAFFMGWIFAKDISLSLSSMDWQPVEAKILTSKVNRGLRGGPDSPWIEFRYVVDNRTYINDRLDFGEWSYGDVPEYLRDYPVDSVTTVYYNPTNPEESVLNKSGSLATNLFLSLISWLFGIVTFYYRFFKREKT